MGVVVLSGKGDEESECCWTLEVSFVVGLEGLGLSQINIY